MSTDSEDVLDTAVAWLAQGRPVALATVIATWGSSPRPLGSQLVVAGDGAFAGSVSGGCVEAAVVAAALEAIAGGRPERLRFGVSDDEAWQAGLACGGRLEVRVERLEDAALLERILRERAARRSAVLVTDLTRGSHALVDPAAPLSELEPELREAVRQAAARDRSLRLTRPSGDHFLRVWNPRARLFVIGAVHVAQPLVRLAELLGFEPIVIDPRSAFATPERFAGVTLRCAWPDEALAELAPDLRSAVVALSHDPRLDDPALEAALRAGAFYVGALGSRRTHAARLERLARRGLDGAACARVRGPVGLDIGALSAAEIATSIMAEVIAELRKGPQR